MRPERARLFDVLAGDPAAANNDEDLVLTGELPEGIGVFLQTLCIAACQDGAAQRIDKYHGNGLASEGIKRFPVSIFGKAFRKATKRFGF